MMIAPRFLWLLVWIGMACFSHAQSTLPNELWSLPAPKTILSNFQSSQQGKVYQLDVKHFQTLLENCPSRQQVRDTDFDVYISLPYPNGELHSFRIEEASVLGEGLGKQFPNIQSFVGYGVEEATDLVRFAWSPHGLQGIILSARYGTIFLDPINKAHPIHYKSYFKKQEIPTDFSCKIANETASLSQSRSANSAGDCMLRKYRIAITCTAEYTAYHGGTTADALAAINTTLTRVNAIFERELSVLLELVDNNTDIIFLDPETDPFPSVSPNGFFDDSAMLNAGEDIINQRIGAENFDVGHLFITGLGGVAGIGVVCDDRDKALGLSGLTIPEGPVFDIDIVAHELGHQFGAEHTFSGDGGTCFRNSSARHSVEPGSGSTIMSYAGLCEQQNVADNVDAYFHALSLDQIAGYISSRGNACATKIPLNNEAPTAAAGGDYVIPRGTPFVLTGEGTDSDGDNLTYTWEQMDNGLTTQPPVNTETTGPLFRSLPPSESPIRYFPNLSDLANNRSTPWEVLPNVGRTLDFRFTVRDNAAEGGCTAEGDIRLTVDDTAGPFQIKEGNFTKWGVGERQTIEWEVANTTNANIGAAQVDIFLSLDGGLTFPIVLAERLANTGAAQVLIPNRPTEQARIMIKGHDHIFFDINNENFIIEIIRDGVVVAVERPTQQVCLNQEAIYPIEIGVTGAFSGEVTLALNGLAEGISAAFSPIRVQAPSSSTLTLSNFSGIPAGTYDFELIIRTSQGSEQQNLQLVLLDAATNTVTLQVPANNAGGLSSLPTFGWESFSEDNYLFQLARSPSFEELLIEAPLTTNTFTLTDELAANTRYYWRVQVENDCPTSDPMVFTFTTAAISCKVYESKDLPQAISNSGAVRLTSTINIPDQGTVVDVNIRELEIEHSWIADVSAGLVSPAESSAFLFVEPCFGEANLSLSFDDEASNSYFSIPCPPISEESYNSIEALSIFNGERVSGNWSLVLLDQYDDDGGNFEKWSMEVCFLDELIRPSLSLSITKQDETCASSSDGQATAVPIDGVGDYSYQWSNGARTATIQNLAAGTYTLTVSDANVELVESVTIAAAAPIAATFSNSTNICRGAQDGFITFEGDPTGLSFLWNNGARTADLTEVVAGTYQVIITDGVGCTRVENIVITEEPPLQISLIANDVSCHGGKDGSVGITLMEDRPLSYQWSDETTNPFEDQLPSGEYGLTITTENGCTESYPISINQPPPLSLETDIQIPTCFGDQASVDIFPAGGVAPYQINCGTALGDCIVLMDSTLQISVTDANSCTLKREIVVDLPSEIQAMLSPSPPSNIAATDGAIRAEIVGGQLPYTFRWNTGATTENLQNLRTGTYTLTIEDAIGCTQIASITLESTLCYTVGIDFSIDRPTCLDGGFGAINAVPTSGNAPFSFEWNTGDTLQQLANLPFGSYQLTVTDALGCTGVDQQLLNPESDIQIELITSTAYSCQNDRLGSLEVAATGGIGALKYSWSNQQVGTTNNGLLAGTYFVTVTDEMGCGITQSYVISNEDLMIRPRFAKEVRLYLDEQGEETIEETMIIEAPLDTCSVTAVQFSKLKFNCEDIGENEVKVTTQFRNASTETVPIAVIVMDTLAPVFTCPENIIIEDCVESIAVSYDVAVSDNCTSPMIENLRGPLSGENFPRGITAVAKRAVDAHGNEAFCDFTVTVGVDTMIAIAYADGPLIGEGLPSEDLLVLLSKLDACDSIDFKSLVRPMGGRSPYEIEFSTSEIGESTQLIVEVTDANKCKAIDEFTANIASIIPQVRDSIIPEQKQEQNGAIFITIVNNLFPITQYEWFFNGALVSMEQNISGLVAGEYRLVLTDTYGCSYEYEWMVERNTSVSTTDNTIAQQIRITPNPSDGLFVLQLQSANQDDIQAIQVFDRNGRLLPKGLIEGIGTNRINLDLQEYPQGIYFVKVQTRLGVALRKIVVF